MDTATALVGVCLLLAGRGGPTPDLVSYLDADDYFRARGAAVGAEQMAMLARTPGATPEGEVERLLAIRWLARHRVVAARPTLDQLARGRLAPDPHGFVADYARGALADLGAASGAPPARGWRDLRTALDWFPSDATLVAALDLDARWTRRPFAPAMPGEVLAQPLGDLRAEGARWAARVGNVWVDRLAVAWRAPATSAGWPDLVRVTGRWDRERLTRCLAEAASTEPLCLTPPGRGTPVTLLAPQGGGALALVGDTDLIIATGTRAAAVQAVRAVLQVRAGQRPGVRAGPLAADLKEFGRGADGLLVGRLPDALRGWLAGGGGRLRVAPRDVAVRLAVADAIHVRLRAAVEDQAAAATLLADALRYRAEAAGWLRELPEREPADVLLRSLDALRVEQDGAAVRGTGRLPADLPWALGEVAQAAVGQAVGEAVGKAVGGALLAIGFLVAGVGVFCVAQVAIVAAVFALVWTRRRNAVADDRTCSTLDAAEDNG